MEFNVHFGILMKFHRVIVIIAFIYYWNLYSFSRSKYFSFPRQFAPVLFIVGYWKSQPHIHNYQKTSLNTRRLKAIDMRSDFAPNILLTCYLFIERAQINCRANCECARIWKKQQIKVSHFKKKSELYFPLQLKLLSGKRKFETILFLTSNEM